MKIIASRFMQGMAGVAAAAVFAVGAYAQDAAPAAAQTPAAAPAAAPAPSPTWSVGPMDLSGFVDGYYSYNFNRPAPSTGQTNQLYNFNDLTDSFELGAAKLTLNHDPDPVGAHVDLIFGRTNALVNGTCCSDLNYIEQAYLSLKPTKMGGFEMDFGKFVTSAGAEVIEAKDNYNYSRSLLFAWAIPYDHTGLRTSVPISKVDTIGVQVVNGWNNSSTFNGGVTIGATNVLTLPKFGWAANWYTGPNNYNTEKGYRNLIDSTITLTPSAKFNAYINYDYGQNRDATYTIPPFTYGDKFLYHWQGIAFAAKAQLSGEDALAGRYEYFKDPQGYQTGTAQTLQEYTATYEHKWAEGLLSRFEYRRDWSDKKFFDKGNAYGKVTAQSTLTAGFIAFFGPKR